MNRLRRRDGTMIAEGECSFEELVAQNKTNLAGADLTRADLAGVDLAGADLAGANLTRAILIGADFTGTVLTGVVGLGTLADEVMELRAMVAELEARGTPEPVAAPASSDPPFAEWTSEAQDQRRRDLLRLAPVFAEPLRRHDYSDDEVAAIGRQVGIAAKAALIEIEKP